jgi:hypothetical protein
MLWFLLFFKHILGKNSDKIIVYGFLSSTDLVKNETHMKITIHVTEFKVSLSSNYLTNSPVKKSLLVEGSYRALGKRIMAWVFIFSMESHSVCLDVFIGMFTHPLPHHPCLSTCSPVAINSGNHCIESCIYGSNDPDFVNRKSIVHLFVLVHFIARYMWS